MPAYKPRRGTQLVAISPGYVECGRCHQRRVGSGEADRDNLRWLMGGHDCNPNRHYFDLGTNIAATDEWIRLNGYAWGFATDDVNDGLRLTRDGSPDVIAPMGSVLLWDGEQITVEEI